MSCTVYGLISNRDNVVRYVGETIQSLELRFRQHRSYAKLLHRTKVHRWLVAESVDGFTVRIIPLVLNAKWHETETLFIAWCKSEGFELLNLTMGGEGTVGWHGNKGKKNPSLSRRNMGNKIWLGRKHTEQAKKKVAEAKIGKPAPWLSKMNKENPPWSGRKHTEETKVKQSLAHKGKTKTPESIEKMRIARKLWWERKRAQA